MLFIWIIYHILTWHVYPQLSCGPSDKYECDSNDLTDIFSKLEISLVLVMEKLMHQDSVTHTPAQGEVRSTNSLRHSWYILIKIEKLCITLHECAKNNYPWWHQVHHNLCNQRQAQVVWLLLSPHFLASFHIHIDIASLTSMLSYSDVFDVDIKCSAIITEPLFSKIQVTITHRSMPSIRFNIKTIFPSMRISIMISQSQDCIVWSLYTSYLHW